MKKRNFRPGLDVLETRNLLTQYPIGNPTLTFQGVLDDSTDINNKIASIGGFINIKVAAPQGTTFQEVTYTIPHSISDQLYSALSGSYTTLGTADHITSTSPDSLSFYMDASLIYKSPCSITASLKDSTGTIIPRTVNFTISTTSPTVDKWHVDGNKFGIMYVPATSTNPKNVGLQQAGQPFSEVFTGQTTTSLFGGRFTVMQMVNGYMQKDDYRVSDGTLVESLRADFSNTCIDSTKFDEMPYFPLTDSAGNVVSHFQTNLYAANTTVQIPDSTTLKLADSPRLLASNTLPSYFTKKLAAVLCFQTYVMYKPITSQEGIWVTLGRIDWQLSCSVTYIGPLTDAGYYNPLNWRIDSPANPDIPWSKDFVPDRRILTWDTNGAWELRKAGF